jgi:diguanylate cyclase (GGDEF)-like protein
MTTFRDISERKKIEEQLKEANELLERLSNIDGLTGIPNRRYFDEMFELEWKAAARNSSPLSILLCDVDYFKAYNDTYGHQAGDYCLTEIARSFSEVLERPRDLGARYGGEEFVILLPDTNADGAMQVAEKIRRRVGMLKIPHATSTVDPFVSTSVGAATIIPSPVYSQKQLLEQADKALYRAKHEGRNRIAVY